MKKELDNNAIKWPNIYFYSCIYCSYLFFNLNQTKTFEFKFSSIKKYFK